MKAKEYVSRYEAEGKTKEALIRVFNDMFKEFNQIAEIRHAKYDDAAISIFQELDTKWRVFARLANDGINPNGFRGTIQVKMPDLYTALLVVESAKR